ncbi:class I SAM-dependent methyltransferase [uncultured Brevundimonas sp.]|uniref:class I SAM-dependent methyltransferase n=1 Tax=uncultured Brevundimonas sp. TaxID=213418 RepID=UPI0025FBEB5E|nr:class I SAM-dependent methyltransferase [uncultured Brevundimonas sp.]
MPPIAVMSFNRPTLLRQVLTSLATQSVPVDPTSVYLFQDGPQRGDDSKKHIECVDVFNEIFPRGNAIVSQENLGVALNFDRAERFFFEDLKSTYAIFFEDDLLLSNHYIKAIEQMVAFAIEDERIAYVSAYGDHRASSEEQSNRIGDIIPMGHKWGFALTRRQWLRQMPIIDGYLEIVRQRPYASRDHDRIKEYFSKIGYTSPGTSQDAAKDVASLALGTVKLNTFACFGKNIGAVGLHSNQEFYDKQGFAQTKITELMPETRKPDSKMIDNLIKNQRSQAKMPSTNEFTDLAVKIFGESPYQGFKPSSNEPDLQGWNGLHGALSRMVRQHNPKLIIDVGVWKGQSTINLAKTQREKRQDGMVIAVDSFLGSPEHWDVSRTDVHASLKFKNGRPSFYETFISNVVLSGLQDQILPIAQTSENAAVILKKHGLKPDLVHIDAAHEYEPALRDIQIYWDLLAPGGVLMGDDFPWSGVARAVVHFSDRIGLPFHVENPKWWIKKPI